MPLSETVRAKLDALPAAPGVYIFRDRAGATLYVGKARSLRSRVRSYFQPGSSDHRFFIARLPDELGDLETLVVDNEKEAALLENALIKEHQPRYNFKLRDDKDFLSLRLDAKEPWPKLHVVRRPRPDGAQYFGPYDSATSARKTLRLVNRFFELRTCRDADFASRVRPCLQHQIKRCPAPCVLDVDRTEYLGQVRMVGLFLDGRHEELVHDLEGRMKNAAAALQYERAGTFRDQLRAIDKVRQDQRIDALDDADQDVLGLFVQGDRAELALVQIRGGRMTNVRTFDLGSVGLPDDELIGSFVAEYYGQGATVPDEIVLPCEVEAMDGLAQVLGERRGRKVRIVVPKRGARVGLVRLATQNAAHAFKEKQRAKDDLEARLGELGKTLRLARAPRRIECIDVSHTGGTDTVAAITAMTDGELDRKRYRSFHVRRVSGGDDYGAMREVLSRRLSRRHEAGWELPDLLVVDGGKGQLGVALAVLRELGVQDLPVAGLAKEKVLGGEQRQERVYLPGQKNPITLKERTAARWFLVLVRDEAHRVSNELRKKLGTKRRLRSALDDVPGIGPRTRVALLEKLGSLDAVARASDAEWLLAGATRAQVVSLRQAFPDPGQATGEDPDMDRDADAELNADADPQDDVQPDDDAALQDDAARAEARACLDAFDGLDDAPANAEEGTGPGQEAGPHAPPVPVESVD